LISNSKYYFFFSFFSWEKKEEKETKRERKANIKNKDDMQQRISSF